MPDDPTPKRSREPWAPIALGLRENLKLELAAAEEPCAVGFYVCAILWSVKHATGGIVYASSIDKVAPAISGQLARRCVKALAKVRAPFDHALLEQEPEGWLIHDYDQHQRSAEQIKRERDAARVRQEEKRRRDAELLALANGHASRPTTGAGRP